MLINFKFKAFVLAIFMAIFPVCSAAVKAQEATEKKVQTKKEGNSGFNFKKTIRVILSTAILASYGYMSYVNKPSAEKIVGQIKKIFDNNKFDINFLKDAVAHSFGDFLSPTKGFNFSFRPEKTITSLLLIGNFIFNIIF